MPTSTSSLPPPLATPDTIPVHEIPDLPHIRPRSRRKKHLLLILAICAAWVLTEAAASWLVQHTRLRNTLSSRLQTAFGRPVDVARFSVNLRGIPALQANSVTVAEDPRFGHEYFLYADTLTFRPRWLPLLVGRLEIGTIEISNPSLNLVRSKDGRWNIEEWLPVPPELFSEPSAKPASANLPGPVQQKPAAPSTPNIRSIYVSGGRINFKRATEKSAFSLIEVEGSVERQNAGRWSINLGASPARAAVVLQQAGTIHVQGEVGGTSSRLRPASVQVTWQDAAVADALRLASAYDHGVRGTFSAALSAHTVGAVWNLSGRAEVRRLHRWDLAMRADNPGLNFEVAGDWLPEDSAVNISSATLETPRSKITGTGAFSWDPSTNLAAENLPENFSITSTAIDGDDLLAWIRAFVPDISNDIALKGSLLGHVVFAGTPPAPVSGSIDAANLSLEGGSLRSPISTRDARIAFTPRTAHLLPSFVSIGASGGSLRAEASCANGGPVCEAKLTGRAADVADLTSASSAVGFSLPIGWHIDGPATFDLHWLFLGRPLTQPSISPSPQTAAQPETPGPTGKITFQELSLRAPFLNQPISSIKGRIDLTASDATLALSSADAFGGTWSGTLDLLPHGGERHFSLAVDRLNSEDLDRWLNPRWRQGFLQNVLPFLASSRRAALPASTQAQGRLAIDEFAFTRYTLKHLQGELLLDGSKLEFENAEGNFYGSKILGELQANLSASPTYKINARYTGLDLALLTSGSALFPNAFSGIASGNLVLNLAGAGRQDLAASLRCEGAAEIQNAGWKGIDLLASLRAEETRPGSSSAVDVAANYTCASHRIEISDLRIAAPGETLLASGLIDATRSLDFRITRLTRAAATAKDEDPLDSPRAARYLLRGPLLHPVITAAQPSRAEPTPQR